MWGWAVAHGGIPLDYAAQALADHPSYVKHTGAPDPTEFERRTWAAEDLTNWEDVVARMAWPGNKVIPRRWGVERTFGRLMHRRRLARDYETHPHRSEAIIRLAMIDLISRRLTRESTPNWCDT